MTRTLFFVLILAALILGGCDTTTFHWITPEAPSADTVVPSEEVGLSEPEPEPEPPCEIIKGNISRDGRKLYHAPGMANYNQVKIDEAAGERFFCSVAEAEAAGWTRAGN